MSDHRNLRILLLTKEQYPSSRIRLTKLFEKELAARGYRISWVMQSRHPTENTIVRISGNNDFNIIPSQRKKSFFGKGFNIFLLLRKYEVASILAKDCDIIIANDGVLEGIIGRILKIKKGLPFCFYLSSFFHYFAEENFKEKPSISSAIEKLMSVFYKPIFDYIIYNCDLFHPISSEMGMEYSARGIANNLLPLPICASNEYLERVCKKPYYQGRKVIVYIGQISRMRRLDFLIFVFSIVLKKIEQSGSIAPILRIIGPSLERTEIPLLLNIAKRLGIEHSIEFIGEVPHDSIPNVLIDVTLGVSPLPPTRGYIPSTPTKCIEYLSLGIPVVANCEIIDQRRVLNESGGGFTPPYDLVEFSNAMLKILSNPLLGTTMGKSGKKWIEVNRNYTQLAQTLDLAYRELVTR